MYQCSQCGKSYEKRPPIGFCLVDGASLIDLSSKADDVQNPETSESVEEVPMAEEAVASTSPPRTSRPYRATTSSSERPVLPRVSREPYPPPMPPLANKTQPVPEVTEPKPVVNQSLNQSPKPKRLLSFLHLAAGLYCLFGFFALFISGHIEFLFFSGVFRNFYISSILLAILFEGVKVGSIVFQQYFQTKQSVQVPASVRFLNQATRLLLVLFSVISSFSKIAEFMDSPNYETIVIQEEQKINADYNRRSAHEDSVLLDNQNQLLDDLKKERKIIRKDGTYVGENYIAKKNLYDDAVAKRDTVLNRLAAEKKLAIKSMRETVSSDPRAKNSILIGLHSTLKNAGFGIGLERFYSLFVLIVAAFTTVLLELTIMTVFNYCTIIYTKKS